MKDRLSIAMNNRPVTLNSIDDEINPTRYTASVWDIIERNTEIGLWNRLIETQGIDPWKLKKLYTAIRMRLYMRGLDKVLHIRITKKDGLCFQWTGNPREEPHKSRIAATHRARLDKKLKLNEKAI